MFIVVCDTAVVVVVVSLLLGKRGNGATYTCVPTGRGASLPSLCSNRYQACDACTTQLAPPKGTYVVLSIEDENPVRSPPLLPPTTTTTPTIKAINIKIINEFPRRVPCVPTMMRIVRSIRDRPGHNLRCVFVIYVEPWKPTCSCSNSTGSSYRRDRVGARPFESPPCCCLSKGCCAGASSRTAEPPYRRR
jgi:hypothetical protein